MRQVKRAGNALDGEWTDGVSTYPSGNGIAGGNFEFHFNVLGGDVNADDKVDNSDMIQVRIRRGRQLP